MTGLTDRIDAIQARLAAARPGPWLVNDKEQTVRVEDAEGNEWGGEIMYDRSAEHPTCWVSEFRPDAVFIANAGTDIEFLLGMIREQEAVIGALSEWAGRSRTGFYDEAQDDVVQIIRKVLEARK